jgi:hypothetical protein
LIVLEVVEITDQYNYPFKRSIINGIMWSKGGESNKRKPTLGI